MTFSKPLLVSLGQKADINCAFLKIDMFMNPDRWNLWKSWKDENETIEEEKILNGTLTTEGEIPEGRSLRKKVDYSNAGVYKEICKKIPKQVASAAEAKSIQSSAQTTAAVMQLLIWIPFVLQFFLSVAMTHVWNIINTMQILNTFSLYKLNMPVNVISLQLAFNKIVNFDILPKDKIYALVFGNKTENSTNGTNSSAAINATNGTSISNALNTTLKNPAFNSSSLPKGMSNLTTFANATANATNSTNATTIQSAQLSEEDLQVWADFGMASTKTLKTALQLFATAITILVMIKVFSLIENKCWSSLPNFLKSGILVLKAKMMYNSMLRASIESYLLTNFACMRAMKFNFTFGMAEDAINSITTILLLPYIIALPIWIRWFLNRNKFLLADPQFKASFNAIYLNVDYFKPVALNFQPILLVRRCIYAINAVFLGYSPIIQLTIALYTQQLICQFLVLYKPMIDTQSNVAQIFNEWSILFLVIVLFLFTDHVGEPETRYQYGWYYCYYIYGILAFNVFLIFQTLFIKLRENFKRADAKWKYNKRQAEKQRHNSEINFLGKHVPKVKLLDPYKRGLAPVEEESEKEENTPREAPPKAERTINQLRQDRKDAFNDLMAQLKQKDEETDKLKLAKAVQRNEEKDKKKLFGPPVEAWEDQVWEDLFVDPSGNLLRLKNEDAVKDGVPTGIEDLELIESPSVRERRKLQQFTDWPLSAREAAAHAGEQAKNRVNKKEPNDAGSNQWSWDNEDKGSRASDWNAIPDGYSGFDHQEVIDSDAEWPDPNQKDNIAQHVGRVQAPRQAYRDEWSLPGSKIQSRVQSRKHSIAGRSSSPGNSSNSGSSSSSPSSSRSSGSSGSSSRSSDSSRSSSSDSSPSSSPSPSSGSSSGKSGSIGQTNLKIEGDKLRAHAFDEPHETDIFAPTRNYELEKIGNIFGLAPKKTNL